MWPSHVNQAVKYIGLSKWEWHINKSFPVTVQIVIKKEHFRKDEEPLQFFLSIFVELDYYIY